MKERGTQHGSKRTIPSPASMARRILNLSIVLPGMARIIMRTRHHTPESDHKNARGKKCRRSVELRAMKNGNVGMRFKMYQVSISLRVLTFLFAAGLAAAQFTQPEPIDFDDHAGWISMFDGKTL